MRTRAAYPVEYRLGRLGSTEQLYPEEGAMAAPLEHAATGNTQTPLWDRDPKKRKLRKEEIYKYRKLKDQRFPEILQEQR